MIGKKKFSYIFCIFVGLFTIFLVFSPIAQAANYWTALPPYNTLWPLWSPALSPIDPGTGLPTPIVTELTFDTKLPVCPGLTWNPFAPYPWLLYCTPIGLAYYDPLWQKIDLWPPSSLLDAAGLPLPLILPLNYEILPPINYDFFYAFVPLANAAAANYLLTIGPVPVPTYLTASALI